jgi:hypothetical protein
MKRHGRATWIGSVIAIGLLLPGIVSAGEELADTPSCAVSSKLINLGAPLIRSGEAIAQGKALIILATGSSSTQGIGASSPALSYPSRLRRELQDTFPAIPIEVINRGRKGQDAGEELARLRQDLNDEHPDLVIWQVGTNALLRHESLPTDEGLIAQGVEEMKQQGVDVVLMDMQYAPRVLARDWGEMERTIATVARREHVGYFRRFEIMREWHQAGESQRPALIGPEQWQSQNKLAVSPNRNASAIAHSSQRGLAPQH